MLYELLHKNIPVLQCDIDFGHITKITDIYNKEHAPIGTYDKNGITRKKLIDWFEGRSIPASRDGIREILQKIGIQTSSELLEKSYGLSLSDQYWIRPVGVDLTWEHVNFFTNAFSEDMGMLLLDGVLHVDSGRINLASPDNTLDGWLKKKWKIVDGDRCLYKAGSAPYFQEPVNEKIASELCSLLGIRHVPYELHYGTSGNPYSVCRNYITENTELVTAYAMSSLLKQPGSESDYAHYVRVCEECGITGIKGELDRMICIDYLMANTDRHWTNFGIVRNADTLAFAEGFPIFDTGTSLWNDTQDNMIGREPVMGKMFQTPLEKHLKYVKDASFLDFQKLQRFPDMAAEILNTSKYIQDERVNIIRNMITTRIKTLDRELSKKYILPADTERKSGMTASWSPNHEAAKNKHEEIIKKLSAVPGLQVEESAKSLWLTMENGLDMRYFFETDSLCLRMDDGRYRDMKDVPVSEMMFSDYLYSVKAVNDALSEIEEPDLEKTGQTERDSHDDHEEI